VKEFSKSVYSCQSYDQNSSVLYFFDAYSKFKLLMVLRHTSSQ